MYATDDVGDAVEATKAFLLPFAFRRWLRIAFVTFFLGGLGANFSTPSVVTGPGEVPTGQPPEGFWLVAGGVGLLALLVAVVYAAVRGVMDVVLLEALREEDVALERFARARWRQGLQLFGFRFGVSVVALLLVGIPLGMLSLGAGPGGSTALLALGTLVLVPVLLVVPLAMPLLKGFTTGFVAPIMLLEDVGILDAWRRFWPTLRGEWRAFAGYAAVNFALLVAVGVLLTVGTVVGALVLGVPLLPILGVGFAVQNAVPLAGTVVFALAGVLYGVAVVVVAAFVKAPLLVFVRYYALFVLGDVNDEFDLVPETRRQVRAEAD